MIRKISAEFVGTFALVFCGIASAVIAGTTIGYMGIAFSFGLALLVMVYVIGPISGCHVNPAVTLGALLTGRIKPGEAVGYMCAQVAGAIFAAGLVLVIAQGSPEGFAATGLAPNGYGIHSPAGYTLLSGFLAETILTMLLVLTVLGSTDVKAPVGFAGLAIGLVLVLIHLIAIPITNASVNPARSIASALFVGGWALQQLWLFIVAPIVGAVVAAAVYGALRAPIERISLTRAEESLPSEQLQRRNKPKAA
jgi:aquaporin Z